MALTDVNMHERLKVIKNHLILHSRVLKNDSDFTERVSAYFSFYDNFHYNSYQ